MIKHHLVETKPIEDMKCWECKWLHKCTNCPQASRCTTPSLYKGTHCVDHNYESFEVIE